LMAFSGRCLPSIAPTAIACASAATMPTVEPIQVPNQPLVVARVTVASCPFGGRWHGPDHRKTNPGGIRVSTSTVGLGGPFVVG
jgi:hypothetical protein